MWFASSSPSTNGSGGLGARTRPDAGRIEGEAKTAGAAATAVGGAGSSSVLRVGRL